jgi:hypothetical protein
VVRKSSGPKARAGSSPALGIIFFCPLLSLSAFLMKRKSLAILAIAVTALVVAAGVVLTRDFESDSHDRRNHLFDFEVYYTAGRSLLYGQNPDGGQGRTDLYSEDFASGKIMDYRYPPLFLVALIPLWALPAKPAAIVWFLLSALSIIASTLILKRAATAFSLRENKHKLAIWLTTVLIVAQYFVMVVHYGNAHLLAISLLFAALFFFIRKRLPLAALLMALAITIKLTPLILLPYFALKKQWKLLVLTGLFLSVINLLPSFYFGLGKNTELLKSWYSHVVADQEFHEINGPINLSLKGQLRRYLTRVDYNNRVDGDVNYRSINFISLPANMVDRIWMAIATVVFILGLTLIWWTARRRPGDDCARVILELGLMICLMLFVGPLTSKIYFIALLWPVFFLAAFAFNSSSPGTRFGRRALITAAAINLILPLLPGSSVQRLLLVVGIDFFVNCLVMTALAYVLISTRRTLPAQVDKRQTPSPSLAITP